MTIETLVGGVKTPLDMETGHIVCPPDKENQTDDSPHLDERIKEGGTSLLVMVIGIFGMTLLPDVVIGIRSMILLPDKVIEGGGLTKRKALHLDVAMRKDLWKLCLGDDDACNYLIFWFEQLSML